MFVESVKTPGIAHLSYLIGSDGEACVIDPQLDTQHYLALAGKHECRITTIIETHRNEDFISGALALANQTGADIYHGKDADEPIEYAHKAVNGDKFEIGKWTLEVIATPGHTKDSISVLAIDNEQDGQPIGVFTGDTLFVSEVGRTDFYPEEKEKMAGQLYDSLQTLANLGDDIIVYPAHGAGSVCGSGMAAREFTTIGIEKRQNPGYQCTSKKAFIEHKLKENHYIAPYFSKMEQSNVTGVDTPIPAVACQKLAPDALPAWQKSAERPGVLIDVRSHAQFRDCHYPGSLNLPGALLSAYGGWFLDYSTPIALVADSHQQATESAKQLWRMGYQQISGYLTLVPKPDTVEAYQRQHVKAITADKVDERIKAPRANWQLLDVRKQEEVENNEFKQAKHIYLGYLPEMHHQLDKSRHYTLACGSGKRATVAASYLLAQGFENVDVFIGSMQAWQSYQQGA